MSRVLKGNTGNGTLGWHGEGIGGRSGLAMSPGLLESGSLPTDQKEETFTQCWCQVGPASATLAQPDSNIW